MSLESTIEEPIGPNNQSLNEPNKESSIKSNKESQVIGFLRQLHPARLGLHLYRFHFGIVVPAFEKVVMAPVYFGAVGAVRLGRSVYHSYLRMNHRQQPLALDAVLNKESYWRDIKTSDHHDRMY